MKRNIEDTLNEMQPELLKALKNIGIYQPHPRLPSDWFQWQIAERQMILNYAEIASGTNILEIGCGGQAITTIPLAASVGEKGRVIAVDRGRWHDFWKLIGTSGLKNRVIPLQEDARKLPFPYSCFDLVVCVHGIRSFDNHQAIADAVKEMLRVTKERIFLAESSPIARNLAQKAHITMYNLRSPMFLALGIDYSTAGDIPYLSRRELVKIVKKAGATRVETRLIEVNMPHHLAWFPLSMIEKIRDKKTRGDMKEKWKKAVKMLDKYGEEHPPVIVVNAWKKQS
ncbi:MAG: methyltransferase domain-containing protein [Candidatus Bathyarchaeota archaeon]|nr:methyltransferase domain-containing protein [Candidatus Bathyarchaeota archaeon]MDH5787811.1 methyltransferase domain-containing protein [Candidatus Bathyarchaeota archaeon]